MRTKDQVRRDVWKAMDREGVSRFPGAEGRIPNFAGAKLAAEKLAGASALEAGAGDQGQPRLAADPRPPRRARGGQDADHGGAAAARPAPLPPARPPQALRQAGARGGDDQGRDAPRPGGRRGGPAGDRLRPLRLGRGQPERRAGRQGRRLLRPRVRAPDRRRQDRRPHHRRHHRAPDPDPARAPADDRARPARRPDRNAAGRDRGRAPVPERPRGILWDHLQPPQIREIPILERMGYA